MEEKKLVMKRQNNIFKVHITTFLYLGLAWYCGVLKYYIAIFLIVLIHEMCHLLMAYFFRFTIGGITLLPFGAFLEIIDYGNYHVLKEMLVSSMGPLSHIVIGAFLKWIGPYYLGHDLYHYASLINQLMFLFNCLPIYPLDGNKIFTAILSYLFPYKLTLLIAGIVSIICLSLLIYFYMEIESFIVFVYLVIQQVKYLLHYQDMYYRLLYLRNRYVTYSKIKLNKGYSLYRPYYNVYTSNKY